MIKILFVCHGNICRSPMAEFIMKTLISDAEKAGDFFVASAATSNEEIGNPVYPPARRILALHGIGCEGKRARRMVWADYEEYDLLIGMDEANLRNMKRIAGGDPEGKLSLLLDHTARGGVVADPWYTGDFETAYREIRQGCEALLYELTHRS